MDSHLTNYIAKSPLWVSIPTLYKKRRFDVFWLWMLLWWKLFFLIVLPVKAMFCNCWFHFKKVSQLLLCARYREENYYLKFSFFSRKYVISHKEEVPLCIHWDIGNQVTILWSEVFHVKIASLQKREPPHLTDSCCAYTG